MKQCILFPFHIDNNSIQSHKIQTLILELLTGKFKKALASESGAQGVLFDEKTEGRKSRETVPLTS
jgi:hypothetical protein